MPDKENMERSTKLICVIHNGMLPIPNREPINKLISFILLNKGLKRVFMQYFGMSFEKIKCKIS